MSTDKSKPAPAADKNKPAAGKGTPASPTKPKIVVPPLFRKVDWLTFGITALLVFIGYMLTLSPDLTLEDSGELATGSFYAGVPHPPGYPLWTIFTWLFTVLLPVSNIAYRVSVASAVSGALASGLLALIVSRGSSMMIESVAELKDIARRIENAICVVSGLVAGLLLAFNGYMWSQSVIVEVYPFSVLSLMGVMCCLLRWVYAPHQMRYVYWAWFLFGVCFTNHQTLIVAAMGIEVAIIAAKPSLGRDLLLWNSVVYVIGVFVLTTHMLGTFQPNEMVGNIFHIVGISSVLGCGWLTMKTQKLGSEALPALLMLGLWVAGAAFYLYMPLTSMTNPPMNWGYPRTEEGFIHALTRGQYEKTNPTNFFNDPGRLIMQMGLYFVGARDEFNLVTLVLAIVPFIFFFRLQTRERAWLIGLTAIWACLAMLLMVLLNPAPDRASRELIRVFFTASYAMVAILIGYGMTLIAASIAMHYDRFRTWAIAGAGIACVLALYTLSETTQEIYGDVPNMGYFQTCFYAIGKAFSKNIYGVPVIGGLILLGLTLLFLLVVLIGRSRPRMVVILGIFACLPIHSIMTHWSDNEQRGHLFGYWFGHDMFTPPFGIYPEMTKDAVLFGGTDPGRFCPTYMIFCESFIPPKDKPRDPKFDRRDVYIITQNALADGTYLEYIRAQYNRSTQIDPPFFQEVLRPQKEKEQGYATNILARAAYQLLDKPFLSLGKSIENRRRREGVYPPNEIYTPTPEDSQQCFSEYLADAQRRLDHDMRFPNEPKQIKQGEDVKIIENRVQVSGQVAVMAINGLLTKVIFDHNPTNEFFVEESFPLDWMYPYLTPFGIIMKINRQPLAELSDDVINKDHEFWTKFSGRLIGEWIKYDTSIKEITDFIERVYLEHDYTDFKGDRKFVRDDQAQKAFSKLRSSIGGIYNWRIATSKNPVDQQKMIKEADFAFRQAFAFCPYSPEAVFRYVQLLLTLHRLDDALLIANTCKKLDPYNPQVDGLVKQLNEFKRHPEFMSQAAAAMPSNSEAGIAPLEAELAKNPSNFQAAFDLASAYMQAHHTDKAVGVLDAILANPSADAGAVSTVAKAYASIGMFNKLETALEKLTKLDPSFPEAWYDLAAIKSVERKTNDALECLKESLKASAARMAREPKSSNLALTVKTDPRFVNIRALPDFQKLVPAN